MNPSCEHCEPAPRYGKAVGDVPLETALEQLARTTPSVERHLQKFRKGFYAK